MSTMYFGPRSAIVIKMVFVLSLPLLELPQMLYVVLHNLLLSVMVVLIHFPYK